MPEELDPQIPPVPDGSEPGQLEPSGTPAPPAPPAEPEDPTAQRLAELEQREKELQRRLRQQGNELARYRQQQAQPTPAPEPGITPEVWFSDPENSTKRVVSSVLSDFERRQEEKRQQERTLARLAKERNMTPEDLQDEYEHLMSASNDPEALVDILAAIRRSRDTDSHIQAAARTIADSTTRNARAVAAQGGASPMPEPGPMTEEQFRQLSLAEQEAYIKRYVGVSEWKD